MRYSNTLILWLGLAILLIGGGFVYVYGSLRNQTVVAVTAPAQAANRASAEAANAASNALRDLGIEADASDLSPEAQAAIARAHQAAIAGGSQAQEEADAAPAADAAPVTDDAALPADDVFAE